MTDYYPSEVGLPFLIIKRIRLIVKRNWLIKRSRFLNATGSLNAIGLSLNALGLRPSVPPLFRTIINNRNTCICPKKFV